MLGFAPNVCRLLKPDFLGSYKQTKIKLRVVNNNVLAWWGCKYQYFCLSSTIIPYICQKLHKDLQDTWGFIDYCILCISFMHNFHIICDLCLNLHQCKVDTWIKLVPPPETQTQTPPMWAGHHGTQATNDSNNFFFFQRGFVCQWFSVRYNK